MEIVKLGLAEMQALYEGWMKEDFPPSELRPWSSMRTLTEQGSYLCFGFQEGGRILAYAAFQEGTVTHSQLRCALEQVYRMTVGLLVGEHRQRFAQVCQVYAGPRA